MADEKKRCSDCYYAQDGICLCGESPKYNKFTLLIFKGCDCFATRQRRQEEKKEEEVADGK
ncbi:MAG: hypothetical protein IKM88_06275 [Lachnospiraceae bacterium]|nr:hypothetical protein [Lachnospiraceae bacterium]MBR6849824.1 hypothetical protein [Lachnospiraceae bacterium]